MVMLTAIGDTDAEHHVTDKRRIWQYLPVRGKVGRQVEHQLINTHRQRLAFEQRFVAAPVLVGNDVMQELPRVTFNPKNGHHDPGSGYTPRSVQRVCRQSAHYLVLLNFMFMSRMIIPESAISLVEYLL